MINNNKIFEVLLTLAKWNGLYPYENTKTTSELRFSRLSIFLCAFHFIFFLFYFILLVKVFCNKPVFGGVFNQILLYLLFTEYLVLFFKTILISGMQLIYAKRILNTLNKVLLRPQLLNVDLSVELSRNGPFLKYFSIRRNSICIQLVLMIIELSTFIDVLTRGNFHTFHTLVLVYVYLYLTVYHSIFIYGGLLMCFGSYVDVNTNLIRTFDSINISWDEEFFDNLSGRLLVLANFKNIYSKLVSAQILCLSLGSIFVLLCPVRYLSYVSVV